MNPKRSYHLLYAAGLFLITSVILMFYQGYKISVHHGPLVDAAMEVKLEGTTAHLWFEEIISGDESIHIDRVWRHIDQADWYAQAMLQGGSNEEGTFLPLSEKTARQSIENVRQTIKRFRQLAEQRYAARKTSLPGSTIDQQFDEVFEQFIQKADLIESQIQNRIRVEQREFIFIGIVLIISTLVLAGVIVQQVYKRDKNNAKLIAELDLSNALLKKNESELEDCGFKRTKELQSANFLLSAQKLAMDAHSIMAMTDVKGTITYINEKFCEISGYSEAELIGQNHRLLNSGEKPKSYWQEMYRTVASGRLWHDEIRNKAKDGHFYWVDTTIVPLMDQNNKPTSYIAIRTDITAQKIMQKQVMEYSSDLEAKVSERTRELSLAKEEAEVANEEKTRFLANMSHELRTPMHAIMSFTQLALKKADDDKVQRYLNNILLSGERLTSLLNNLLDLAKLEAKRTEPKFSAGDLADTVSRSTLELDSLLQDKQITILFQSTELSCSFDPSLITQVIINLLSNAIKFSPDKGTIKIELQTKHQKLRGLEQDVAQFSIKDQGIGIPVMELDGIFDKFTQSSATLTKAGGTGLGLPISREIITLHNGVIWAESPVQDSDLETEEMQVGAAFHFIIPISQQ